MCDTVSLTGSNLLNSRTTDEVLAAEFWLVMNEISEGQLLLKYLTNRNLEYSLPSYLLTVIQCKMSVIYISCFSWYFGKIKRLEAEKKLLLGQNEHGAFLIRDSESRRNDFSLSVRDGDTVKHYRIRYEEDSDPNTGELQIQFIEQSCYSPNSLIKAVP